MRNTRLKHAEETVRARARAASRSLSMPRRPSDEPELPDDPTDLDDSELMSLLVLLTRWADYSGAQLAMAAVDERTADTLYDKAKAVSMVRGYGGKEDRVTMAKARLEDDEDVQRFRQEQLDAYAYRKLVEARHEAFVRDAAVVSRELTRRVDRDAPQRRGDRWGGGS